MAALIITLLQLDETVICLPFAVSVVLAILAWIFLQIKLENKAQRAQKIVWNRAKDLKVVGDENLREIAEVVAHELARRDTPRQR